MRVSLCLPTVQSTQRNLMKKKTKIICELLEVPLAMVDGCGTVLRTDRLCKHALSVTGGHDLRSAVRSQVTTVVLSTTAIYPHLFRPLSTVILSIELI